MSRNCDPETYESFDATHRGRLQQVFVARFGPEVGNEATADTMAYAFENWARVSQMANPVGYLF